MKSESSIEIADLGNNLEHLCGSFEVLHQHCISHLAFVYKLMKSGFNVCSGRSLGRDNI